MLFKADVVQVWANKEVVEHTAGMQNPLGGDPRCLFII